MSELIQEAGKAVGLIPPANNKNPRHKVHSPQTPVVAKTPKTDAEGWVWCG